MKIGVIGLAFSHPYTYSSVIRRMGHTVDWVWDTDAQKAKAFADEHGAMVVENVERLFAAKPDGIIISTRGGHERTTYILPAIEQHIPTYIAKPLVTGVADLEMIVRAARTAQSPIMSTSVLRFAPGIRALGEHVRLGRAGTLLSIHASAVHSIARYMEPEHRWQDDLESGGGTLVSMGVHALDPIASVVGCDVESVSAYTTRRLFKESLSEDAATVICRYTNGLVASIDLVGGFHGEFYGIDVYGSDGIYRARVPSMQVEDHAGGARGGADAWTEYGYVGTMTAFLEMCRTGTPPIPLEETTQVMRTLLTARRSATESRLVRVDELGA